MVHCYAPFGVVMIDMGISAGFSVMVVPMQRCFTELPLETSLASIRIVD
ncbi:Uncharacterized protein APZ42_012179 [Daphnia magna]|uniref:Uncharacterized protein n=1 Tax=Daphnia magna TaxID=35525 RepID=A0A162S6U5_9CRUS|nr:Uncharacterized protein APZ42_012179 [Daphnia magna]